MRKLLAITTIAVCAFPTLALASYNDVTLTTDAVIQVGSYTLDITGSSATIQSITVNPTDFTVTLASGSSATISSPTFNTLSSDITSDVTSSTCTGSASSLSLAYSGSGTVTNTITPSATICTNPAPSGGGGGGGGGGGPIVGSYGTVNAIVLTSATTSLATSIPVATSTTVYVPTASSGGAASSLFTRDLTIGSVGPDVLALQQFLNTHGYPVAASGPGSPGNETQMFGSETQKALAQFQAANGISPASGYFGPVTRALVLSMWYASGTVTQSASISTTTPATATSTSLTFSGHLKEGEANPEVLELQEYLNAQGDEVAASGPGSKGDETDYFGLLTDKALIAFQDAHAAQILAPEGLTQGTGYFGSATIAYIDSN